jgi:predicted esterase
MLLAGACALVCVSVVQAAEKPSKHTVISNGAGRTYYLFVPDRAKDKPAPLIILLHGSGRDGKILVDHWESLAKKEGIILAGPDATVRAGWGMSEDGPPLMRDLLEAINEKQAVDLKRVYIFGHSVHAGALEPQFGLYMKRAPRKIPIAIWVGTNDSFFPLAPVRATRDALNQQGFNAELTEITGHTHDYYSRSSWINSRVWDFLKDKHLDNDPQYQDYVVSR